MNNLFLCMFLFGLASGGCVSYTSLNLQAPSGAEMRLKNENHVFPSELKLAQRTSTPGVAKGGYDVEMKIPYQDRTLAAHGKLYVFEVEFTDVDRLAKNHFSIPQDKLEAMEQGAAITIEGYSADGKKPVYRAVLGLKSNGD